MKQESFLLTAQPQNYFLLKIFLVEVTTLLTADIPISIEFCILSHNLTSLTRRFPLLIDHKLHEVGAIIYPLGMPHTEKRPSNHLLNLIAKLVKYKVEN